MKRRIPLAMLVLTLVLMMAFSGVALADLVTVGDTEVTGSFTQCFDENGSYNGSHYNFDTAIATCLSGAGFERASGSDGWNTDYNLAKVIFSSLSGFQGDLPFGLTCNGSLNDPFSFDWCGYQDGKLVFEDTVCWDGLKWTCDPDFVPVPIPPTVLLLGSGLLGLGLLGWRKKTSS